VVHQVHEFILLEAEERWVLLFGEQLLDVQAFNSWLFVHVEEESGVTVMFDDLSAF
jgi:hypothetical protein